MKKDYYAILGVKPSASEKEIRSAYKRLAKKHHPDVNPGDKKAEEKFKEISEAYDVLTDPEKKRKWEAGDSDFESYFRNAGGGPGRQGGGRTTTINVEDLGDLGGIFGDLFGNMGGARGRRSRMPSAGADLQYPATISFMEAVQGTTLRIPLARTTICPTCGGEGSVKRAGGSGRQVRQVCPTCDGAGRVRSNEDIKVRIPPGVDNGGKVRVAGRGEAGEVGSPGDLYVELNVTPHPYFRRDGREIVLDLPLTIAEATFGAKIDVPTIEGRVTLTVPPGAASGQRMRLKGRGVPSRNGGAQAGDQIVVLQIATPRSLDDRSREILSEFDRLNPYNPREGLGWPK